MKSWLENVRHIYSLSGVDWPMPRKDRLHHPDKVRVSSLGTCPLKAALEKANAPKGVAEGDPKRNPQLARVLDGGNYIAPMFQVPLMWFAAHNQGYAAGVEVDLTGDLYAGRADAVVYFPDGTAKLIDFKYSMKPRSQEPGEPRYSHGLQLLAYASLLGPCEMYLVSIGKSEFEVWQLRKEGEGYRFYNDSTGLPYKEPAYVKSEWNKPHILNMDTVEREALRIRGYMQEVAGAITPTPPVMDPLNNPEGWECVKLDKKALTVTPSCGYCDLCHGIQRTEKVVEDGGRYSVSIGF